MTIDLEDLGLDAGGYLIVQRALRDLPIGSRLAVHGRDPALRVHLAVWSREQGHGIDLSGPAPTVVKGSATTARWSRARRAGDPGPDGTLPHADVRWGLAMRGALVEEGGPPLHADLIDRGVVWAEAAQQLYQHGAARQWNPDTAVRWDAPFALPSEIEGAVVQVMTYLVENEYAAMQIPAGFIARMHPHYREVMQVLAIQVADEARHVEVFTRRAMLRSSEMGVSGAGGRASLQTLLDETDFSLAAFLLSVLGEGSFLDLLEFITRHAPDPVTREVAGLALRDERRHVAFGMAHLKYAADADRALLGRLRTAVERRHDALADTAGLNQDVFDSLVVLAAHAWTPESLRSGWNAVQALQKAMNEGRQRRLVQLGFPSDEAVELSALHTRNFM
ncbi:ferritin-like domain-containing protein [Streptacidiphilus carbonis]|uniref:ferritin-like domain-containing protein n=1 Tax=Streptacidiphilus carbonis TaxID=105422 RepID=UPI0006947963|nr:ferritin-like domain-containing protein [Streptacidiphilus carbonis]